VTAAAARLLEPRYLAALGVLFVAAAIGALSGYDPKIAIAASLGLAFVLIALGDLAFGIAVFATLTYLELAPIAGGGPAVSFAKLAGLTLGISWIAALASRSGRSRMFFTAHPGMTAALGFFAAWTALSLLWTEDQEPTVVAFTRLVLNMALIPIVFTGLQEARHLRWVAAGIVAGAGLAAAYGLLGAPSVAEAGDLNRIAGTVGDPNLLASVLVVGLVMAMTLLLDAKRSIATRGISAGVGILCMAAIFATASRGGIVAMAAALVAAVVLAGPRRGRMAFLATSVVVLAVGYFAVFASTAQVERLTTADGGAGRTDIWQVGWRMAQAEPLHGVGAGNFPISSVHYLLVEPGAIDRADFIVDRPAVAHNTYLEILAELGIVGLVLMLTFILIGLLAAIRAAWAFDRIGEDGLSLIARGVAVGLISVLAADFFLSNQVGKLLWLLIALGPAMLAIARRMESESAATSGREA